VFNCPLLTPCPNKESKTGDNRDKFMVCVAFLCPLLRAGSLRVCALLPALFLLPLDREFSRNVDALPADLIVFPSRSFLCTDPPLGVVVAQHSDV
jgi:hypothetical protein